MRESNRHVILRRSIVMQMVVKNGRGSANGCLLTVEEARGAGVSNRNRTQMS